MLGLNDLKQTKVYQEALQEGEQRGELRGEQKAKLAIASKLRDTTNWLPRASRF